jgi:hypothetical protein
MVNVQESVRCVVSGLLLAVALTSGCQLGEKTHVVRPPYTAYRSPNLLADPPRRILVMPVISTVFDGGYSQRWYHLFTSELRSLSRFEVVNADADVLLVQQCLEHAQQGLYPEASLVALAQRYRVDAVIFTRMDNFDPYWPPRMSLNINLVETFNGETLAAVDGNWDARDECTEVLIHDYARSVTTSRGTSNPDLFVQSPEYFGKFVANSVAFALCSLFRDERGLPRPEPIEAVAAGPIPPTDGSQGMLVVPASCTGSDLGCAEPVTFTDRASPQGPLAVDLHPGFQQPHAQPHAPPPIQPHGSPLFQPQPMSPPPLQRYELPWQRSDAHREREADSLEELPLPSPRPEAIP